MASRFFIVIVFALTAIVPYKVLAIGAISCPDLFGHQARYSTFSDIFRKLPNIIYDHGYDETDGKEFYASNEFDFADTHWDTRPVDVFVGFGTNGAWDLAVRKNAKVLVLGDWTSGPLVVQEMLMRPLLLTAQSPSEFLSMLNALPVLPSDDLRAVFDRLTEAKIKTSKNERFLYSEFVISQLGRNPLVSADQVRFVKEYFRGLLSATSGREVDVRYSFATTTYSNWAITMLPRFFQERYDPRVSEHVNPDHVNDPYFSFLSSQQAFDRLKNLFNGNVYYVRASYDDPSLYHAVRNLSSGPQTYAINLTNIIDVMTRSDLEAQLALAQFAKIAVESLDMKGNLAIFQTREVAPPHTFELYEIEVDESPRIPIRSQRASGE